MANNPKGGGRPKLSRYTGFNVGTGGFSTAPRKPKFEAQHRIKLPQIPKRPVRFQIRTLIRHKLLRKTPFWYHLHRRGVRRPVEGQNPLETRAAPKNLLAGRTQERIVWQYLVAKMHMVPMIDFVFQTSEDGGRLQLGGLVVDFSFPLMHMVLQVDGPTHESYQQMRKDSEQDMILFAMGYQVFHISTDVIDNEYEFEDAMRKIFDRYHSGGGDSSSGEFDQVSAPTGFSMDQLYYDLHLLEDRLRMIT